MPAGALVQLLADYQTSVPSLEDLFTLPEYFGVVTATDVQRAICRVADGRPLGSLAFNPDVIEAMGDVSSIAGIRPRQITIVAAIRGAKSQLCAAAGLRAAASCNVSRLGPGETARVSMLSLNKDKASATFQHLRGPLLARPALRRFCAGDPSADTCFVRQPTGAVVDVCVQAGAKAGAAAIARYSAGIFFDEAPRMNGAADGVVNLDETVTAAQGRLLDMAQVWKVGSPWQPAGPVYEEFSKFHLRPTRDLVVMQATGPQLNPYWWTAERMEEVRRRDPLAFMCDVMAKFASPAESLFASHELEAATREEPLELPYDRRFSYVAAMDPATRGNGWTLVIVTRFQKQKIVALVREWRSSAADPLSPRDIMREVAQLVLSYNVRDVLSDQVMVDALRDFGRESGINVMHSPMTQKDKERAYLSLKARIAEGEVELPPEPQLRADLVRVRKRAIPTGYAIDLPSTGDGRHCDYVPALVLAMRRYLHEEEREPVATPMSEIAEQMKRERKAASAQRLDGRDRGRGFVGMKRTA